MCAKLQWNPACVTGVFSKSRVRKKKLLLLVDDEAFNLALMELVLGKEEFEFVRAENGAEALQKLREIGGCDAILLDRMMPEMDGIEMLKALKADPRYSGIPVIMQSAVGTPEKIKEAIDAGAIDYVVKPYDDEIVLGVVKKALETSDS